MAMARTANKGSIKKGEIRNPEGRGGPTPLPPEEREALKMTKTQILEIIGRLMTLRQPDVIALLKNENTPMFHRAVASIILSMVDNACEKKLDFVLNRLIGKVTDRVEVDQKRPVIIKYQDGESVYLGPPKED